ncbi:alpha-amylase family glycosyl hydrolase [Aerolutibacter daejeonensis]|uniref:alpha-amylase family glycosyl hydrolase n=1 Tax=Aerolutibacter daejeonensis TaxID=346181 RepID=UPI00055ED736|nr:alpha-amylase family glycosyl hydrolase [Lysobacter daejeonensis]
MPAVGASASSGALHVPSPDWRDQVIYFAMIDRFDDGDPRNNDQGKGEFDPRDGARYSGGDLRGLARRLDYIRGLGATAVWVTPPVAHQWWNRDVSYGGYHGYWAEHFKRIDAHFGTLDDYRALSRGLHARGMYLVQDIVVNHVANYGGYKGGWSAGEPAAHFVLHPAAGGRTAPTQAPFDLNDPRRRAHRAAAIYHWTPDIRDYADPVQERDWQMAGLDDLNTENPRVRDALRDSYAYWIREAGVDAYRVDTAFYVPPEFFADFLHGRGPGHPGILQAARATGREQFHVFGEGFGIDRPFEDMQARRIDGYMRGADGTSLLPGMINFPLYGTTLDVFARGQAPAALAHRIANVMQVHAQPHLMPSFIDNHDVDRFLAGGTAQGLKQALLMLMTLPGIPTVYYGTEQGFTQPRAAMFAAGYGAGGRDHFDAQAPLYRYLQQVIALRRGHRVFSRGVPEVLHANAAAPGALAYRMRGEGEAALVVFNTADRATLLDNLDTGLPAGTVLRGAFAIDASARELVVGEGGRVTLPLVARSGQVWLHEAQTAATGASPSMVGAAAPIPTTDTTSRASVAQARDWAPLALDGMPSGVVRGPLSVRGTAPGRREIRLVVDGDVASGQRVRVGRDGRWQARVATAGLVDAAVEHRLVAWDPVGGNASAAQTFRVDPVWTTLAVVEDPADDDHGPTGQYRYPDDAGWHAAGRVLDLRGVRVVASGGALQLELQTAAMAAAWNPANGFDHAAYTVYVQLPGRADGATVMPQQNAHLPDGMRWHYRLRVHGWSNTLFAADGATATDEGAPVTPAASLAVDRANATLRLTLPASALGHPATLAGVKVYVTTWDYDGGYRALTPAGGAMVFGGGDGAIAPRVMDAVIVSTH